MILLIIISNGCSEDRYLDLYPITGITEGNYYNDLTELTLGLNDIYRQMAIIYDSHGLPCLYGEQASDNTRIIAKASGDNFTEQIFEYNILPDNGRILTAWRQNYSAINICNVIIDQIEKSPLEMVESLKNRMLAEAKLVRSLLYFNMVRAWGDIPLITEQISSLDSYNYLRVSTDNIYDQLLMDLNFAKSNLPENYTGSDIGRVTRYAAAGLLAKIYMTMGNTASARAELEFIINSGKFSLDANNDGETNIDDYKFIFHPDTKNSISSILEVQYKSGPNAVNSTHQSEYAPFSRFFNLVELGVPGSVFTGWGINTPTVDLVDEYENGDPRLEGSIVPGYTDLNTGLWTDWPFTIKYFDYNFNQPGNNLKIIRYADVLLMYAEVTQDQNYLNMVRDRAGLPLWGSEDYPYNLYPTLDLAIEHERRIELAFEFHRTFDLVRTGRAIEVLQSKGFDINENKLLFPIPQDEIDINPKLTQNPGY